MTTSQVLGYLGFTVVDPKPNQSEQLDFYRNKLGHEIFIYKDSIPEDIIYEVKRQSFEQGRVCGVHQQKEYIRQKLGL